MHRLNMELDLQSLFGLYVHSCTHWLRPRNFPPSPRIWAHIRGRYWTESQDRRHLFVTSWLDAKIIAINWFENILAWA
jgi:hypothetical protein